MIFLFYFLLFNKSWNITLSSIYIYVVYVVRKLDKVRQ